MAALLIASLCAVALGLQMHWPPCKLIHLSSFFRSSFLSYHMLFPACRPAAMLPGWTTEAQGRWTFLSTVPTSNLLWTLRLSMVPSRGQDPDVTEGLGSAGGRGFCCPLALGVKEQKTRSERWPRRERAKPWKFKQIQGGEKVTLVVLHSFPSWYFVFLTGLILRIRIEPETVLSVASVGRN